MEVQTSIYLNSIISLLATRTFINTFFTRGDAFVMKFANILFVKYFHLFTHVTYLYTIVEKNQHWYLCLTYVMIIENLQWLKHHVNSLKVLIFKIHNYNHWGHVFIGMVKLKKNNVGKWDEIKTHFFFKPSIYIKSESIIQQ